MKRIAEPYKILIADSDRVFVQQCKAALSSTVNVSEIRTAHSGTECMGILKNFVPTIIFLGVNLEKMNGLVTARFIRSQYAEFTLYYLAERVQPQFPDRMDSGIVDGYFTKSQFSHIISDSAAFKSLMLH
ncbi:MAG: response regulator [Bacteroidota bacterium]